MVVYPGRDYGDTVVGCYKPTGQSRGLVGTAGLVDIAAAGPYVAVIAQTNFGSGDPFGPSLPFDGVTVSVFDLRTGRLLRRVDQEPLRVFVGDNGAAAYFGGPPERRVLFLLDRSGNRIVDTGPIQLRSIHFAHERLVWRHADLVKSLRTHG